MQNQTRIVIENLSPQIDCGAYFIKRIVGQTIAVSADVFSDGHDIIECCVKFKHEADKNWQEVRMVPKENEQWTATFKVEKQGLYSYFVEGWVDYALNLATRYRTKNQRQPVREIRTFGRSRICEISY